MLPKDRSYAQRFKFARDAGFDAIEMQTIAREDEAAGDAAYLKDLAGRVDRFLSGQRPV